MLEGEIIKYYREKMGLTQAMLGEGICTTTHVSKIERGKTAYSADIIALFSERLGIDIENEIKSIHQIQKKLQEWHSALIMQKENQIEEIKQEFDQIPFIQSSQYASHYYLVKARYYFHHKKVDLAYQTMVYVEKEYPVLSNYEKNFFLHLKGMYYLQNYSSYNNEDKQIAITILKQIDIEEYRNEEVYYHMACAYRYANSKLLTYIYAEKALKFFKSSNNYIAAINAETLMLMQYGSEVEIDFPDLINRYHHLIHNCEVLGAQEKKAILLNNLGVVYFQRKEYDLAAKYFEESVNHTESNSTIYYLRRFTNYIESCTEGLLVDKVTLLRKIKMGMTLAKNIKSGLHYCLLKVFKLKIEDKHIGYYTFLAEEAIPLFLETNNQFYSEQYGKKLYKYYLETEQFQKAIELSKQLSLIDDKKLLI